MTEILALGLACLAGALFWSFAEYALHRWWGHAARGRNDFSREHLAHHHRADYFTPTSKKVRTAIPPALAVVLLGVAAAGPSRGAAFAAGFLAAYAAYEAAHRGAHVRAPRGPYGRWLRRHHFYHHFHDARVNHGVTSPVWDLVFGSYVRPPRVRVPERFAMAWLLDPGTGEVRAEHAADYVILRKREPVPERRAPAPAPAR